ncbi:hypothetical protein ACP70R_029190 [Stipagrostis hirtigluma subsp. patula]
MRSSLCCKSGRCACHTRSEAAAVSQCSLPRHRLPASPTPSTAMATPLARRGSRPRAAVQQHRAAASARHGGAARGEAGGGAACGAGPSHGRERGRADGGAVGDGGAGDGVPRMWGRSTDTARQARRASQAMQIGRFCCCYSAARLVSSRKSRRFRRYLLARDPAALALYPCLALVSLRFLLKSVSTTGLLTFFLFFLPIAFSRMVLRASSFFFLLSDFANDSVR